MLYPQSYSHAEDEVLYVNGAEKINHHRDGVYIHVFTKERSGQAKNSTMERI